MTERRRFRLEITLEGPLLTRASGGLAFGVDQAMQLYHGRPAINGSLIRGHIRHLLGEFVSVIEEKNPEKAQALRQRIEKWFGRNHMAANETDSGRTRLDFDFFWLPRDETGHAASLHNRIRIGANGAVDPGALIISESPLPAGAQAVFVGEIRGRFANDSEAQAFQKWCNKALRHLPAIGAMKGAGFGRIEQCQLLPIEPPPDHKASIGLTIEPDRPLCIARPPVPRTNFYVSEDHIPGNALKAVLAEAWRQRGGLPDGFDALRITHALPATRQNPARSLPLPLSLAVVEKRVVDLALFAKPVLIKPNPSAEQAQAPLFQPDWKPADRERAEQAFGAPPALPQRWLSVRTSIDAEVRNQAREDGLFSLECADPAERIWCADLDLSAVPEPQRQGLLDLLPDELENLGKTKARAKLQRQPQPFTPAPHISPIEHDEDAFIVLLRTPARLFEPPTDPAPANPAAWLEQAYAEYWRRASAETLELSHFFAQQQRFGGELYWNYYRKHAPNPGPYRPEWLTVAGSVFVLRATANRRDEALELLQSWQARGLPLAADRLDKQLKRIPGDWKTDPFIPENGFGECVVNLPQQLALMPDPKKEQPHELI